MGKSKPRIKGKSKTNDILENGKIKITADTCNADNLFASHLITRKNNANIGDDADTVTGTARVRDTASTAATATATATGTETSTARMRDMLTRKASGSGKCSSVIGNEAAGSRREVLVTPVKGSQYDDIALLSGTEPTYEVGWKWNSPSTQGADLLESSNIADVMKTLKEDGLASRKLLPSNTPPLLGLWMTSPGSSEEQRNKHVSRIISRPRRCRYMGTKTDVNSNALLQSLQKLAAVMESNDARKDGDLGSPTDGIPPADGHPPVEGIPTLDERPLVEGIPSVDGILSVDGRPSVEGIPSAAPRTPNQSTDDLWADDELFESDSFLQQTQHLCNAENFASPKLAKRLHSTPVATSRDTRHTFSLDSRAAPSPVGSAPKVPRSADNGDVPVKSVRASLNFPRNASVASAVPTSNGPVVRAPVVSDRGRDQRHAGPNTNCHHARSSMTTLAVGDQKTSGAHTSLRFDSSSAERTRRPADDCVFLKPQPPSQMNTSISDDLLATLAEPDEVLDSQVCGTATQQDAPVAAARALFDCNDEEEDDAVTEHQLLAILEQVESQESQPASRLMRPQPSASDKYLCDSEPTAADNQLVTTAGSSQAADNQLVTHLGSSQPRCSQDEIARKKQEAMRRRRNRLQRPKRT